LGLFDKFIKVPLRVLSCFEAVCGNPGAHDRSLFIQDAGVDHEHRCLDVGRARYIGNCPGLHPLLREFSSQESATFQTLQTSFLLGTMIAVVPGSQ
jgi:hypothetical protein